MYMESGMKSNFLSFAYKCLASMLSALVLILIHDYVHMLYLENFTIQSHGITLGFVRFYMLYVMIPFLFIMAFCRSKIFFILYIFTMLLMMFLWLSSHPLRVCLMAFSYSVATYVLYFIKSHIEKIRRKTKN